MSEIEQAPRNGYNVVSTFSGGGGSCLGYRMAGFRVLWANEFVEEAQNTYRINHPGVQLDTRDIREVTPQDILAATGLKLGELDLFDGSPPCCAFSTAGKREKNWGAARSYSDGKSQQIETLFYEYIRLLDGLKPKTFVAENVSGLVKGCAIGYFKDFVRRMQTCGYRVAARLINAKYLGVPQSRERVIFIGVRDDLGLDPVFPQPEGHIVTLGEAFHDLPDENVAQAAELRMSAQRYKWAQVLSGLPRNPRRHVSGSTVANGSYFNLIRESLYEPCSTICQTNGNPSAAGNTHPLEDRKFTICELKRIMSVPDDFKLTGNFSQQWERLGRMVPPLMMMRIAQTIRTEVLDRCGTT